MKGGNIMRKAGGIIAIIAGVFAVFAAGFTLMAGGLGSAFEAEGSETVVMLGWGGVLFSFLTIVLGAVTLAVERRIVAVLLILCAVGGAILGGTFVAVFMVLVLVGGVLALFDKTKEQEGSTA